MFQVLLVLLIFMISAVLAADEINVAKATGESESPAIQYQLGLIDHSENGVPLNDKATLEQLVRTAEQGMADAQFTLGRMYEEGDVVPQIYVEASRWYRLAADQGHAVAQYNLGRMYEEGKAEVDNHYMMDRLEIDDRRKAAAKRWYDKALSSLQKSAEQGTVLARYSLGNAHYHGRGVPEDRVQGRQWYRDTYSDLRDLAVQNHTWAQYHLAELYYPESDPVINADEAIYWYRKAAERGHAEALYNLGKFYELGWSVALDDVKAIRWIRQAARRGSENAIHNLLATYFNKVAYGTFAVEGNVEADQWHRRALPDFRRLAEQGNSAAQYYLAEMYDLGIGVAKNDAEVVRWLRIFAEQGDIDAQARIAYLYDEGGIGLAEDNAEAAYWYLLRAEDGEVWTWYNLGRIFDDGGKGVVENDAIAADWYRQSASRGRLPAQMKLIGMYAKGAGVVQSDDSAAWLIRHAYSIRDDDPPAVSFNALGTLFDSPGEVFTEDDVEAKRWFRKAAEMGYSLGQYNLDKMAVQEETIGILWAKRTKHIHVEANDGDVLAQFLLSWMYAEGEGVAADENRAAHWNRQALLNLRRAAEGGKAWAQYKLGLAYYSGHRVPKDDAKSINWIRKAAEQGDPKAQNKLAELVDEGTVTDENDFEAVRWYRLAAGQGIASAQIRLGEMYDEGTGVQEDDEEALRWYRQAAGLGNKRAQFKLVELLTRQASLAGEVDELMAGQCKLGLLYAKGEGVAQDSAEAVRWYQRAAEQGHAVAQFNLGLMYDGGEGVAHDDIQAVYWYRQSAEQGNASAQNALGNVYSSGIGAQEDDVEAVQWYRQAAVQGHVSAQVNLAAMYGTGQGVVAAPVVEIYWTRKAAEQGDVIAQGFLSHAYDIGRGLPEDDVKAYAWVTILAARQVAGAEWRQEMANQMTLGELQKARELAKKLMRRSETFTKQKTIASGIPQVLLTDC